MYEDYIEFMTDIEKFEKNRIHFWNEDYRKLYLHKMLSFLKRNPSFKRDNEKERILKLLNEDDDSQEAG